MSDLLDDKENIMPDYIELQNKIAEGTSNTEPSSENIKEALNIEGFNSEDIKIWYDDLQQIWRFTARIKAI